MHLRVCCLALATVFVSACGSTSSSDAGDPLSDPQLPPTSGAADIETWLAKGLYKSWHCETMEHAARSPSPHNYNRVCNNALITAQPAGPGEYPVGAAAVKEIFGPDAGTTIIGYAVEVHVSSGKNTSNWFWYERDPSAGAPAKNGSSGLVAVGIGPDEGVAGTATQQLCTGCHSAAGSDAAHNTTDSHDFVYTHVP